MTARPLVCLITPGHAASTPRLVKEADALVEAGYRVHVVAGRSFAPVDPLDAEIFSRAKWDRTIVDYCGGPGVFRRKVLRRVAQRLVTRAPFANVKIAARAHHAEASQFVKAAARVPAGLYLGHCLAGLPAAALAARARGVPYGFDAEDLHDAETNEALARDAESTARRILQRNLLPGCTHFTASSPLIGERYAATYGVPRPRTVLNVFPLDHAPSAPIDPGPVSDQRPARFYWFSQTIGPGRGLEAVVTTLAAMRTPAELHLRGFPSPGYREQLEAHASRAGLRMPIKFLKSGPPQEMARLAADADLGLCVEESQPLNHDLCLANKIFVYLLAGIPQLLSMTTSHTAFVRELGVAALLGDMRNPPSVARALDEFFSDPARVADARRTASELARQKFCWDREQETFLDGIAKAIAARPS